MSHEHYRRFRIVTYVEDWGWLGSPKRPKKRLYVRRIILYRPGEEDLILVTSLCDAGAVPAVDLLEVYLNRWGIECFFRTYKRLVKDVRLVSRTVPMVVREAEISLLACQLLLGQGALALKVETVARLPGPIRDLAREIPGGTWLWTSCDDVRLTPCTACGRFQSLGDGNQAQVAR